MTKAIIITGSTRGIGYSLAKAFVERGYEVTISSRTWNAVDDAIKKLGENYRNQSYGFPCDVTDYSQVEQLWENAKTHFGKVDIWINNAGIAAPRMNFWELTPAQYEDVVKTNILGTMFGSKVALSKMIAQGYGALYNLEGYGARGGGMQGVTLYGSTKACVHFINKSLAREAKGTPVITGAIAPGMVITDMITRQYEGRNEQLDSVKKILNIIAEKPETVAPVLVDKIPNNHKNGALIAYSSPAAIMLKFLIAPFRKRDLFS